MLAHIQVECPCGRSLRVADAATTSVIRCWDCRAELRVPGSRSMERWAAELGRLGRKLVGAGMLPALLMLALLLANAPSIRRVELWGACGFLAVAISLLCESDRGSGRERTSEAQPRGRRAIAIGPGLAGRGPASGRAPLRSEAGEAALATILTRLDQLEKALGPLLEGAAVPSGPPSFGPPSRHRAHEAHAMPPVSWSRPTRGPVVLISRA